MRRNAGESARKARPSEQRSLPRKKALLNAVVVDIGGEISSDCTIEDINARSAQISFSSAVPIDTQIYLLDASNRTAHLARVMWCRSDRAGLRFIESHTIDSRLPQDLKFLWKAFLEAKFKEVYRHVSAGVPFALALTTAGLDEEHLRQMARYARVEKRFEILLRLANGEDVSVAGRYRFNAESKAKPA
jgi:hypothetical protein